MVGVGCGERCFITGSLPVKIKGRCWETAFEWFIKMRRPDDILVTCYCRFLERLRQLKRMYCTCFLHQEKPVQHNLISSFTIYLILNMILFKLLIN